MHLQPVVESNTKFKLIIDLPIYNFCRQSIYDTLTEHV